MDYAQVHNHFYEPNGKVSNAAFSKDIFWNKILILHALVLQWQTFQSNINMDKNSPQRPWS